MVDADDPFPTAAGASAGGDPAPCDLARLSELLQLTPPLRQVGELTRPRLAQIKPLVERTAFSNPSLAQELAGLLTACASASDDQGVIGLAHWIAGNVAFLLDRPLPALAHFEQAEAAFAAAGETLEIARMGVGKVSALDKAGRYEEALRCGEAALRALAASSDETDQRRVAGLYNGIGINSEHLGRYAEALEAYERKLRWWRGRTGEAAVRETSRSLVNIGVVNARLGQYTEAHEAFSAAQRGFASLTDDLSARHDAARCAMNVAWLAVLRQGPDEMVAAAFAAARELRGQVDPHGESTDLALLDLFEAEWLWQSGRLPPEMAPRLADLQARLATAGLAYEADRSALLLAQLATASGEPARAAEESAAIAGAAAQRGDTELAFLAGVAESRALKVCGRAGQARAALERVVSAVEATRGGLLAEEHRAGFLTDKLVAYRALASLCLDQGDDEAALAAIERSKARVLAEVLNPPAGAPPGDDPVLADLIAREREIRAQLQALPEADPTARRSLEQDLQALRQRRAQRSARYTVVPYEQFSAAWACPRLPPDTLLLAYGALPDRVVVFPFDRNGPLTRPLAVGPLPTADELRLDVGRIAAVGRLPRSLAERSAAQQIRSAQAPLARWYDLYLRPLQSLLDRYARVLVIPDDLLNNLPFNAFFDRERGNYLIQTHGVLVAPSLTTWALLSERSVSDTGPALVVGHSCGGRLPRAVAEAQAVAGLVQPATLLLEEAATREAFASAASGAGLIHVATHGVYRADAPAFSYLQLADGRLEAFDIGQLTLSAETVVLSACETGAGRLTGNELMGLARAFLHAGARSVVATHWAVDDEATGELMRALFGAMTGGLSAMQALRAAQSGFLDRVGTLYEHPYYWASIAAVGAGWGSRTDGATAGGE